ncbi:MAG: hypothetical protein RIQ56_122 [Candidatus Parcubacteria bacterium]|jgi:hypothetical protein
MNTPKGSRGFSWVAVALAILAIATFLHISPVPGFSPNIMMYGTDAVADSSSPAPMIAYEEAQGGAVDAYLPPEPQMGRAMEMMKVAYPVPAPSGGVPITDTREFNKTYYNAQMQTRDVPGLTRLVETTIRGSNGRIDQISSSQKYGSISFAVPQTKFDSFREQIETYVDWRFLEVNIQSQNMLSQKISIEEQQKYVNMSSSELSVTRKKEVARYEKERAGLQAQIDANEREIAMLDDSARTANETTIVSIKNRQIVLYDEQSRLRNSLALKEREYSQTIRMIDAQAGYLEDQGENLEKQDDALLADVATVNGTISIRWVSLWEVAQAYLPGYSIPGIFAILAIAVQWWYRRRNEAVAVGN